ncbi:helix-turn-helix domain-containing protein [Flavobacterium sp. 11]|uniref:helix-turn-helix domain-containing protein n=1 Tax=Flavobacterium sp. 11 TaxID=357523 RepID=UPI000C194691|nr:helix-turn-helix domain-containing protein [Flavobacterium sp. 11]PIF60622.1 helix-turn-helix protein [Flavobacterium sp. 11]
MAIEILTKADLHEFRKSLLEDIREILKDKNEQTKKWLKSTEVRKLLKISPGTLQNLRINGTLSYTKINGIIYYDHTVIEKLLNGNKVNTLPNLFK